MSTESWDPSDFDLGFRRPEPQPVPDCADCRQLVQLRHAAREMCDLSAVTDSNILLRRHQSQAH